MKHLIFTIFFLSISPTFAYAACSSHTCSDVKITKIYVSRNSWINIATNGTETGLTNCAPSANVYIRLNTTHGNADKIYSLLLTALVKDLNVRLRTNDTSGNTGTCTIQYAVLEPE